jgi:bifunctional ADP-heptose synthase (sugar kinase/adenylyltransferase)
MQMPVANTGSSAARYKAVYAGGERNQAAHIANVAAGIVVSRRGTACVAPEDIFGKTYGQNERPASFQILSSTPFGRAAGV